jgi:serine/threonine protein kinase
MHLDFKLGNAIIMPTVHGQKIRVVKLIDFGGARIANSLSNISEPIRISGRVYTTDFCAPELAMTNHVITLTSCKLYNQ